ncbi:hypothetical protein CLV59_102567 [Chitinophaga dinghuensis]|uniref:Uncharacterized protein n=1 Tax=Chitinophaga dinghuensis TaxID=1539050 RepID=A0A327W7B2_9BACT|nr:hypothetical protein [Chitinophaga dinghuensis]RAJ85861.1 hypothetical protein CLV59_102567 [Chitinophaga dinghuensis]
MQNTPDAQKGNYLQQIHKAFADLPIQFRERLCQECQWSIPTFYRMIRSRNRYDSNGEIVRYALSNSDASMIEIVGMEFLDTLQTEFDAFTRQQFGKKSQIHLITPHPSYEPAPNDGNPAES